MDDFLCIICVCYPKQLPDLYNGSNEIGTFNPFGFSLSFAYLHSCFRISKHGVCVCVCTKFATMTVLDMSFVSMCLPWVVRRSEVAWEMSRCSRKPLKRVNAKWKLKQEGYEPTTVSLDY